MMKAKHLAVAAALLAVALSARLAYREAYSDSEDKMMPAVVQAKKASMPSLIPKVVVRCAATPKITKLFVEPAFSCINLSPEYRHLFFDDAACEKFVRAHYPDRVARAYDKVIPGAYKSDLFRMCYLYRFGGVYFDINKTLLVPLSEVIDNDYDLVTVVDLGDCGIYQAFLACRPGLTAIQLCIDKAVTNILNEDYGQSWLDITGPQMMGRVFRDYYGECFTRAGVYHQRGEFIKMLQHAGDNGCVDDKGRQILSMTHGQARAEMNASWKEQNNKDHYGILYRNRQVFKKD